MIWRGAVYLFVLLFLLWLLLNGGCNLQIAGAGLLAAGLVAWGCERGLGLPFWGVKSFWYRILRMVGYLPLLLREVWTANFQVILRILCPKRRKGAPRLTWIDPGLQEAENQLLLANSITLTPGTVTVALHRGRLCVYALDQEFAADLKDSKFVRQLRRWEGNVDG